MNSLCKSTVIVFVVLLTLCSCSKNPTALSDTHHDTSAQAQSLTQDNHLAPVISAQAAPNNEVNHIPLIEHTAWQVPTRVRDSFKDHRPAQVDCDAGYGWRVELSELEIRTGLCNYLSLSQASLLQIPANTEIEVVLSHSSLIYTSAAQAHVALSIAGATVMELDIPIPNDSAVIKERIILPMDINYGDDIELHLHNHGSNAWTLHSISALVDGELDDSAYCKSYNDTFAAIQETVFEPAGCANSLCHGESHAAGLDLRDAVAYANLVDVTSTNSSLLRVDPRSPTKSFLYQKLAEKIMPGSYEFSGSAMPSAGDAISADQLEAIRLWIEAGAPETGSVGDYIGRGEDEIESLLGVCLPEPNAVSVQPLAAPAIDEGVQFRMPAHGVAAESERELCFATYYDYRDQIPEQYMDANKDVMYVRSGQDREDPFTHHLVLMSSGYDADHLDAPEFGTWTCSPDSGDLAGNVCEPIDPNSCGAGMCRSQVVDSIACNGYGPGNDMSFSGLAAGIQGGIDEPGYYLEVPAHGIFYWNSHAFNLTTEDAVHRVWKNLYFTDDLRYDQHSFFKLDDIFKASGVPPFSRETVCSELVLHDETEISTLSSHTHKRGEYFYIDNKGSGERVYESFHYDDPAWIDYDPPLTFAGADLADRTLRYCAEFNNGLNTDGSYNIETVKRLSTSPRRSSCSPTACAAGNVGAPCNGADDNASCDSSPGAGDGQCDACAISSGFTSDDEMFILIGVQLLPGIDAE